jgi:carbonic anhydrase
LRLPLANLRIFLWIAEREAKGDLEIIGLHFGIREGTLSRLGADQTFRPVD